MLLTISRDGLLHVTRLRRRTRFLRRTYPLPNNRCWMCSLRMPWSNHIDKSSAYGRVENQSIKSVFNMFLTDRVRENLYTLYLLTS